MLDQNIPRVESRALQEALNFAASARCALLAGLALIVFVFLPGPPYRLDQYDVPKDVGLGVLGIVCGLQLLTRQHLWREDRIGFTLLAFLCWGALAVPLVGLNDAQGWRTLGIFSAAATVFLLARSVGASGAAFEMYWGALGILFIMCALVLLEAYGGMSFLSAPGRRPGATLGNRNLVARLACLALPLLWNRLMVVNRTAIRLMLLTMTSGMVAVIVLSRSRGAFLVSCGLVICLPLAARWRASADTQRRWQMAAFPWIAAVVFAGATVVVLPNRLGWSATDFRRRESVLMRSTVDSVPTTLGALHMIRILIVTIAFLAANSGCTKARAPSNPDSGLGPPPGAALLEDSSVFSSDDAAWARLALEVPGGFAGIYLNDDGRPVLLLTQPEKKQAAIAALSTRQFVALPPGTDLSDAIVKRAKWNFAQLFDWARYVRNLRISATALSFDIDEVHNRIAIGVLKRDVAAVEAKLDKLSLPRGLVSVHAQTSVIMDTVLARE